MSSSGRHPWDANDPYPEPAPTDLPRQPWDAPPTDRPVEPYSEINPPPHETIPESADVSLASIQEAVRATPPPVPARTAMELVDQLAEQSRRDMGAAHRGSLAMVHFLTGSIVNLNYMCAALGELNTEDVAPKRALLKNLLVTLEITQGRVGLLLDATQPAQAAE